MVRPLTELLREKCAFDETLYGMDMSDRIKRAGAYEQAVLERAELKERDKWSSHYVLENDRLLPILRELLLLCEKQREVIAHAAGPTRDVKTPMLLEALAHADEVMKRLGGEG